MLVTVTTGKKLVIAEINSAYTRSMKATPSIGCANNIFCWRHHTDPVRKSCWWKMDNALKIVLML